MYNKATIFETNKIKLKKNNLHTYSMQNFAIFLYFIFPINMLTHYVHVMCIYTQQTHANIHTNINVWVFICVCIQ